MGGKNVTSTSGVDDMLLKTNLSLILDASRSICVTKPSGNSRCTEARNLQHETSARDRRSSLSQVLRIVSGRGARAVEEDITSLVEIDMIGEEAIECQPVPQQAQSKSCVFSGKGNQKSCIGTEVCTKDVPPSSHASLKKPVIEIQNDNYYRFAPMVSVKAQVFVRESSTERDREFREVQIKKYKVKNVVSLQPQCVDGNNLLSGFKQKKNTQKQTQRPRALVVEKDDSSIPTRVEKSTSATRWISLSPKDENCIWAKDMIERVKVIESTKNENTRAEIILSTASPDGKKLFSGCLVRPEGSSCQGVSSISKQKVVKGNYQTAVNPQHNTKGSISPPRVGNEWVTAFSPHVYTFGGCDLSSNTGYSF